MAVGWAVANVGQLSCWSYHVWLVILWAGPADVAAGPTNAAAGPNNAVAGPYPRCGPYLANHGLTSGPSVGLSSVSRIRPSGMSFPLPLGKCPRWGEKMCLSPMIPSISGSIPLISHSNRPPDDANTQEIEVCVDDLNSHPKELDLVQPHNVVSPISSPKGRKNGSSRKANGYGNHRGSNGVKFRHLRSIRKEKNSRRYSPLLSDLRVREFLRETQAMAGAPPVSARVDQSGPAPTILHGLQGSATQGHGNLLQQPPQPPFVEVIMTEADTSMSCNINTEHDILLNKEIDLGVVEPTPIIVDPNPTPMQTDALSAKQKAAILGFIKVTHAVPKTVANAWDMAELEFFSAQCEALDLDPDMLLVDDDSFLEDYLMGDSMLDLSDQVVSTSHKVPASKKQAILNALQSPAKAVKAKDMQRWTVGEWV
ncbi:hypothetical protein R6Q59_002964 [Mikania micrantha]